MSQQEQAEVQIPPAPPSIPDGVDVSHYQGGVDWAAVKASGSEFAFCKATQGVGFTDPMFAENWSGMRAAGLIAGAYHFFQPGEDPVAQAQFFAQVLHHAGYAQVDLPPVLDIETAGSLSNEQLQHDVRVFLETIKPLMDSTPIIYTNPSFWNAHMNNDFGMYPLWIAEYDVSEPNLPTGWAEWSFWQFSNDGVVPGIEGPVDLDKFNGSFEQLHHFALTA